jgi:hypothetical protein
VFQHERRSGEQPGRYGDPTRLQLVDDAGESAELPLGVRRIVAVMGVSTQSGQAQPRQLQHGRDRLHGLFGPNPQSLQADVDLDEHAAGAAGGLRVCLRTRKIHERRGEGVGDGLRRGLGQGVGIDEDGPGDPAPAKANALGQVSHGQRIGAMRHEGRPQLGRAVPVAVSLDHGKDLSLRPHEQAHRPHVGGSRIEVDLERGGPGWTRGDGHGRLPPRAGYSVDEPPA